MEKVSLKRASASAAQQERWERFRFAVGQNQGALELGHIANQASSEQDLQKFMAFVREIDLIREEKQERLAKLRIPSKPSE